MGQGGHLNDRTRDLVRLLRGAEELRIGLVEALIELAAQSWIADKEQVPPVPWMQPPTFRRRAKASGLIYCNMTFDRRKYPPEIPRGKVDRL